MAYDPAGAVGPPGPPGEEGPQGPQGVQGIQGEQGIQGVPGDAGPAGDIGPQGPQGVQGVKGDTGDTGSQGIQGNAGAQGSQGIQGVQGIQGIQGVPGPNNLSGARTTAQRTTTATGMANVTDLAVALLASQAYTFDVYLFGGCNNTGGSQFSVTVPAGATLKMQATGNTNAATAYTTGAVAASDGASPTFYTLNAQGRTVELHGVVVNGANAGNIQVRFKSVTNGQTTTVDANSYMVVRRH